jgi:hypothetical protein
MARASREMASRLSVMSNTSRLRSNSRASSSRRASASSARSRAIDDRRLATRLTARNAKRATQFWGSAIVSAPMGGRKNTFRHTIAVIDVVTAIHKREVAATTRTTSRKLSATVVALVTFNHRV